LAVCHELRACGATYPFQQALKPKHLIEKHASFDDALAHAGQFSDRQITELRLITHSDQCRLQVILDINHRLGKAHLSEHGFAFKQGIYWPSRLRRQELTEFVNLPNIQKKGAIRAAITNIPAQTALASLLLPLLRPSTIRRIACSAAPIAERGNLHEAATQLYLRTGDLNGADRCAYQAASTLRGEHRSREAILCINAVLDLAKITDRIAEVRSLLMLKGDIQKEIGEVNAALETYHQIVELYRCLPVDKLLAETFRDMGDLYKMKQDSKSGLEALNQALEIYRQMGEELEMSRTYNNIGNSYFYAGDILNTLRQYRAALKIQRRLEATAEIASTLSNIGSVYCVQGKLNRGIFLLQKSLELKKELGDAGEIARTLNNLGYVQYLKSDYDQAKASLLESLEINTRIGSMREMLFNLENLTSVLLDAGQLKSSLAYLEQGIGLTRELNDLPHQLTFSYSMAVANLRMGKPIESERQIEMVFDLLKQVEDPRMSVLARISGVQLRLLLGDLPAARELVMETEQLARERSIKPFLLQTLVTAIRASGSSEILEQVRELGNELGQVNEVNVAQFNLVEFLLETGESDRALEHLSSLRSLSYSLQQNIDRPRLRNVLVELLIRAGYEIEAQELCDTNRQEARQLGLLPEYAHALLLSGQIRVVSGEIESAYADYRQALQLLKSISDSLCSDHDRASFQSKRVVKFLVSEIRRLGALLGPKQRAGSTPALP
jgi:tetratricopeptide (TPR) repeat protein